MLFTSQKTTKNSQTNLTRDACKNIPSQFHQLLFTSCALVKKLFKQKYTHILKQKYTLTPIPIITIIMFLMQDHIGKNSGTSFECLLCAWHFVILFYLIPTTMPVGTTIIPALQMMKLRILGELLKITNEQVGGVRLKSRRTCWCSPWRETLGSDFKLCC